MNKINYSTLLHVQKELASQINHSVDVYYLEGYGALFVIGGYNIHPNSIIYAIGE
jgi:hypothetical protein